MIDAVLWSSSFRFRLLTIDAGLLTFEDFRFGQSIYAVISNPKPAKFKTLREPLYRLKQSSHITVEKRRTTLRMSLDGSMFRILVFAKQSIVTVDVQIDGKAVGQAVRSIDNKNLFVLPWKTSLYNDEKLHRIVVNIRVRESRLNGTNASVRSSCLGLSRSIVNIGSSILSFAVNDQFVRSIVLPSSSSHADSGKTASVSLDLVSRFICCFAERNCFDRVIRWLHSPFGLSSVSK